MISPGGKPVTALPGDTPTFPDMVDSAVLVTVWPASTANGAAVCRPMVDGVTDDASVIPLIPPNIIKVSEIPATMLFMICRRRIRIRATSSCLPSENQTGHSDIDRLLRSYIPIIAQASVHLGRIGYFRAGA